MRGNILISCLVLLLGCESPEAVRERAWIMRGLEKRVSPDEAKRIKLAYLDSAIESARALNTEKARDEAEVLTQLRQQQSSKIDSFLVQWRQGDELWVYRTYLTPDRRGGEEGLAIIRNEAVADHLVILIHD